jgi:major vault protein
VGPATFTRQDHEKILFQPKPCIAIPPRSYCRIRNPALRDGAGKVQTDATGQVILNLGDEEIRLEQEPFPLMPGEVLLGDEKDPPIKKLSVIPKNTALRLKATRDFVDGTLRRVAGDEWMFEGPDTYMPRVEVEVVQTVKSQVIKPNSALRLRARIQYTDRRGNLREVGEEWLIKDEGAYMTQVEEEVVGTVDAKILTDKVAIRLEATRTAKDVFGKLRKAGEQWLVTNKDAATHIPDVFETVLGEVKVTTLSNRQYTVVVNPVDPKNNNRNRLGEKEIRKGEASFFLHPGESLANGIEDIIILSNDEALLLKADEEFTEVSGATKSVRKPGERWMIQGPIEYIPPTTVTIVERRRAIALDENEGVYIRDSTTGKVRDEIGKTYMLKANESLWEKEMHPAVEDLLMRPTGTRHTIKDSDPVVKGTRVKSRVVRFNVQHNAAVQIYDYKLKKSRIVFGPDLVMLAPDEQFTVLSISGDKPKVPNIIKSLQLFLGPDFMSDTVIVETSDHARLQLKLSYNWQFMVPKENVERIFAVPDFVGDACKAIASRVRGAVASESFDSFHRNSARIIRTAVFGMDEHGKIKDLFMFNANHLAVTNIDIQSVEPTDTKTRDSLQKSVQLAIAITTQSQEAAARQEKERKDQEATGQLERQKLVDKAAAEKSKTAWLTLQAESSAIEACGKAIAESKARAEAALIEGQSELKQAQLRAEAYRISAEAELDQIRNKHLAEIEYTKRMNELELKKARDLSNIEAKKLDEVMKAIGADTVIAIASAGPEMQAKLLEGLGLKGYLITDGNSPINLFSTASGLLGGPTA